MRNHFGLGKVVSMLLLIIEGIIALSYAAVMHYPGYKMFVYAICWIASIVVLFLLKTNTEKQRKLFFIFEITLLSLMCVGMAIEADSRYILLITVICKWIMIFIYLHKNAFIINLLEDLIIFAIFTFGDDSVKLSFTIAEFLLALIVLILIYWVGSVVSEDYEFMIRTDKEQNAGMDDLFTLVSDKFREAKVANEAKSRFLARVSHEIRTPINAVLGMDTMILRESKEAHIKEYAVNIQNAGNTLLSLINDILDISKIESGKMEIIPVEYDLYTLIYDVMNMIGVKAESKGINFAIDVDASLPSKLCGDDIRIRQIILNLMNNAVKYTEKGSVSLIINGEANEGIAELNISIKDTGRGIKEEDIHKLYEDFVRIEESKDKSIEGSGLGMSITVQLLELMNSKLEVSSVYGEGSEFSFKLVQKVVDDNPIGDIKLRLQQKAEDFKYESKFKAPNAKVLVVDDTTVNRMVFIGLLKDTEIKIDQADGGIKGLEKILNNSYDLIFLDHMMPDMDGVEVIKKMKENNNHPNVNTPVIALTANVLLGAREEYLSLGFNNYLTKPINPDKLEKMIYTLLSKDKKIERDIIKTNDSDIIVDNTSSKKIEFPMTEGIDWNYAKMHLVEDDLLMVSLRVFKGQIDSDADELEQLYNNLFEDNNKEAFELYRNKLLGMRKMATLLGCIPIAGMAAALESAAGDGDLEIIKDMTKHFVKKWREYKDKLSFIE